MPPLSVLAQRVVARVLASRAGTFGAERSRLATLGEAIDRALDRHPAVVSVDVFDTVLVRPVVGDLAWFGLVSHVAGAGAASDPDFVERRSQPVDVDAPSLADIYSRLDGIEPTLATWEFDVERKQIRGVPGAAAALGRVRDRGVQLCFTSDTHFDEAQLRGLLEAGGILSVGDVVVSSSAIGASKSSGGLFERLPELLGVPASEIVHIGDNAWADGAQARSRSISSTIVCAARPSELEAAMARDQFGNGPLIAAAARSARLGSDRSGVQGDLFELGTAVPGQCFVAFLIWVKNQCEAAGISDIAFLSRDGELPLMMAQAMPPEYFEDFNLSYLHCSRRAWQIAAANAVGVADWIAVGTENETSFINHYAHVVPFRSLLHRIGMEVTDLDQWPTLSCLDPDEALPVQLAPEWERLLADPAVRDLIGERSGEKEEVLLRFLRQNRIGERPLAIVDVGWRGQLAWMVSALVRDAGGEEPLHLHFGGDHVNDDGTPNADIRRFALDDSKLPHPIDQPVAAVEVFTGSGKARLMEYVETPSGEIEERFDNPVAAIDSPARQMLWHGAIAVAGAMPPLRLLQQEATGHDAAVEGVRAVLAAFWNSPDDATVRAAGHLYVEADDVGHSVGSFIEPYSLREVLGSRGGRRKWRAGSLCVTWRPFRDVMKIYFRLRHS